MVGKIAFLFPGQGSQVIGMGKFAFDKSTKAQYLFEKADRMLGFAISKIMFEGPEERLRETSVTQPALFLASAAALELIKPFGIKPSYVAGHSLGEYSALYASGALSFDAALKLVHERGKAMSEAAQDNPGTMAAVLGLPYERLAEICSSIPSNLGPCVPANYNSDSQIVISGTTAAVAKVSELCTQSGALKVIALSVSGAFHSPLMAPAAEKMKGFLNEVPFTVPDMPVIANVDAQPTSEPTEFRRKLIEQIDHGVLWHESLKFLINSQVETFIEVGSGRVLTTLVKKLDRKKSVFCTDEFDAIEKNLSIISSM